MSVALLIGLNYTGTNNNLKGCINDCILIQKMLIDQYGFKLSDIVFMRDDIYKNNHALYPSKKNIITQLTNQITKANKNKSNVYLHFSGHGSNIRDTNGDESDGFDEFIVPRDYFTNRNIISDDELNKIVQNLNDNSQMLAIFDCCMSGTLLDLAFNYSLEGPNTFVTTQENRKNILATKKNILCLSGCRDNEYSLDIQVGGIANGALTLGIFNVLKKYNWTIDLKNLVINLYRYLKNNKYDSQRPLLSSNIQIDTSTINFLFKNNTIQPLTNVSSGKESQTSMIELENTILNYISKKLITVEQLNQVVANVIKKTNSK